MSQNITFIHNKKHLDVSKVYNYLRKLKANCNNCDVSDIWFFIFSFMLNKPETCDFLSNVCRVNRQFNQIINVRIKPIYVQFDIFAFLRSIIGKTVVYNFYIPKGVENEDFEHIFEDYWPRSKHFSDIFDEYDFTIEIGEPKKDGSKIGIFKLFIDFSDELITYEDDEDPLKNFIEEYENIKKWKIIKSKELRNSKRKELKNLRKILVQPFPKTFEENYSMEDWDHNFVFKLQGYE